MERFYWGAATSSHQIEGGNKNDWTEWEKHNASRLASLARRKRWPDFILRNHPSPIQPENYVSGRACDHYNRFREDFDIARSLGHNAHRFSLEWSRIEPEEGKFNEKEIQHYREVIAALRERGMEPFVTLWHWTVPRWFAERGGWLRPDAGRLFARFAARMAQEFGRDVRWWLTMNELETFARHGYFLGDRPPGRRNPFAAYRVLKALSRAHRDAYHAMKEVSSSLTVGFTESVVDFESYGRSPLNLLAMRAVRWWRNNPFFGALAESADFIGLQHYFHSRIRLNPFASAWGIQYNENKEVSDVGWEIYPESIYLVLKELARYGKPVVVTENGLADARDIHRARYIDDYVGQVLRAKREGVDVRGYFYWSLLDNFEWQSGFWPRFGLVEVDYRTLERRIRPSAWRYKELIEKETV